MHGAKLKLHEKPPHIPLLTLDNQENNLQTILNQCHEEKRLVVAFAGSITWPPYREAMADYIAFANKYKNICKCIFIYIKEAHFVERD